VLLERDGDGMQRAAGIEMRLGGGAPLQVRAAREVVLASGAVGTPALLQHSGIGPAPLLQGLGIRPRHALCAVFKVRGMRTLNSLAGSSPARPASGWSTCCDAVVP
jgi:choline dehydrogenase